MKAMPSSSERLAPQSILFSGLSYKDVPKGLAVTLRSRRAPFALRARADLN